MDFWGRPCATPPAALPATTDSVPAAAECLMSIAQGPLAIAHAKTLRVIRANDFFLSEFGAVPGVLDPLLKGPAREEVTLATSRKPVSIELQALGRRYSISARRGDADGEHAWIAICFQRMPESGEDGEAGGQGGPPPTPTEHAKQLSAFLPIWDSAWIADTTLAIRTNLTALISMGQLLETTHLSPEQSLYTQNMRYARTRPCARDASSCPTARKVPCVSDGGRAHPRVCPLFLHCAPHAPPRRRLQPHPPVRSRLSRCTLGCLRAHRMAAELLQNALFDIIDRLQVSSTAHMSAQRQNYCDFSLRTVCDGAVKAVLQTLPQGIECASFLDPHVSWAVHGCEPSGIKRYRPILHKAPPVYVLVSSPLFDPFRRHSSPPPLPRPSLISVSGAHTTCACTNTRSHILMRISFPFPRVRHPQHFAQSCRVLPFGK
jgi:hypothetical protein